MNCAFCPHHKCYTEGQNCTKYSHEEVCGFYSEDDRRMMRASSATESRNYMKMTRLEESAFFAKELGVKKIGIAFCIGLANEAHFCAQYFKNQGFAVESVCCKVCSVDKDMLELEKIKHENYLLETEKLRLELEKMKLTNFSEVQKLEDENKLKL